MLDKAFNPTDPAHYVWWRNALHKAQQKIDFEIPVDKPQCGYYRMRRHANEAYQPVAIWYRKDGSFAAKVGQEKVEALKVWSYCARRPITEEEYRDALQNGFPAAEIGDNKPPEGADTLKVEAETLLEEARNWIKQLPGEKHQIETQEQADKGDLLVKKLRKTRKDADETRKKEKAPYDERVAEVQAKWNPTLEALKKAVDTILARQTVFLSAQKAKAAKVEAETGMEVSKPKAGAENTVGGVHKATHLRAFYKAEVVDPTAAATHYANHPEILAIIQKLAIAEYRATNQNPPGVTVKQKERAV